MSAYSLIETKISWNNKQVSLISQVWSSSLHVSMTLDLNNILLNITDLIVRHGNQGWDLYTIQKYVFQHNQQISVTKVHLGLHSYATYLLVMLTIKRRIFEGTKQWAAVTEQYVALRKTWKFQGDLDAG